MGQSVYQCYIGVSWVTKVNQGLNDGLLFWSGLSLVLKASPEKIWKWLAVGYRTESHQAEMVQKPWVLTCCYSGTAGVFTKAVKAGCRETAGRRRILCFFLTGCSTRLYHSRKASRLQKLVVNTLDNNHTNHLNLFNRVEEKKIMLGMSRIGMDGEPGTTDPQICMCFN